MKAVSGARTGPRRVGGQRRAAGSVDGLLAGRRKTSTPVDRVGNARRRSRARPRGSLGLLGNIIVGIIGAVLGGFLFGVLGLAAGGLIGSLITAVIGAVVLLFLISLIKKA